MNCTNIYLIRHSRDHTLVYFSFACCLPDSKRNSTGFHRRCFEDIRMKFSHSLLQCIVTVVFFLCCDSLLNKGECTTISLAADIEKLYGSFYATLYERTSSGMLSS